MIISLRRRKCFQLYFLKGSQEGRVASVYRKGQSWQPSSEYGLPKSQVRRVQMWDQSCWGTCEGPNIISSLQTSFWPSSSQVGSITIPFLQIGELQRRQIICPRLSSCRYSQYNFKRRQPDPEAQALKHCTLLSQTCDYGNNSCAMSKCLDACVAFHL